MGATLRARVLAIIAVLLGLLVVVAVSTLVVRLQVQSADRQVNHVLVPAQDAAFRLSKAWVDQETGERGYILTGDPTFLQPYVLGQRDAALAQEEIARQLRHDATAATLLQAVERAGAEWTARSAGPELSARMAGHVASQPALVAAAEQEKTQFDVLRSRLDNLSAHINARIGKQLGRARAAQTAATAIALAALAVALLAAIAVTFLLRRVLVEPVARLIQQVQRVAGGDVERSVETGGPAEVAAVAAAVEHMRVRILHDAEEAARTREELARHAEDERIARDLHDLVIQRLFAAGMRLESAAARNPAAAPAFRAIVDELDLSIRELRTVIFGLTAARGAGGVRDRVLTVVRDSERTLGFRPTLVIDGPVESVTDDALADDVASSLTEILSNVARHAHASRVDIRLEASPAGLHLTVSDDGVGIDSRQPDRGDGVRNLRARAAATGGACELRGREGGGTTVDLLLSVARTGVSSDPL
jgi:signal transduction histidine kinase